MLPVSNETIQGRFKLDKSLESGYRYITPILSSKHCLTIDDLYLKGYEIIYNYSPYLIINVRRIAK